MNYTQPHHDHHHYNIQNAIHTLLYTSNKQINSIANRIVDDLGGKYSFIGMDIQLAMPMTGIIHNEINDIIECFKDPQCVYAANTPITHHSSSTVSVTSKDIQMPNKNVLHDKVSSCLATMASSTSSSVSIPHAVFVGAELHGDPRSYPHLTVLFREVKQCLFTVYDFKYEMFGDISGTNGALVDERIPLLHFTPLVSEVTNWSMKVVVDRFVQVCLLEPCLCLSFL